MGYRLEKYSGVCLMYHYANSYEQWDQIDNFDKEDIAIRFAKDLEKGIGDRRYRVVNTFDSQIVYDTKNEQNKRK